jgi:hypothetical protein
MRSALCVMRNAFCVMRSAFCVMRRALCIVRTAFCVIRDALSNTQDAVLKSALLIHTVLESNEPSPNHVKAVHDFGHLPPTSEISEPLTEHELALQFTTRSDRVTKKSREVSAPGASTALSDIGAHRLRRSTQLGHQTESLTARKGGCDPIYLNGKILPLHPNPKLFEVLNVARRTMPRCAMESPWVYHVGHCQRKPPNRPQATPSCNALYVMRNASVRTQYAVRNTQYALRT